MGIRFFRRHPELSLRTLEPTSIGRVVGFNHVQVERFYDILQETYEKQHISPSHIWNVDETGLTSVHRPVKVTARTGQRHVGKITSGEKGKMVTAICAMNATGSYIPPTLILRSQGSNNSNMKTRLLVVFAKDVSVTTSVKPMDENGLPVLSATLGSTMNVKT